MTQSLTPNYEEAAEKLAFDITQCSSCQDRGSCIYHPAEILALANRQDEQALSLARNHIYREMAGVRWHYPDGMFQAEVCIQIGFDKAKRELQSTQPKPICEAQAMGALCGRPVEVEGQQCDYHDPKRKEQDNA